MASDNRKDFDRVLASWYSRTTLLQYLGFKRKLFQATWQRVVLVLCLSLGIAGVSGFLIDPDSGFPHRFRCTNDGPVYSGATLDCDVTLLAKSPFRWQELFNPRFNVRDFFTVLGVFFTLMLVVVGLMQWSISNRHQSFDSAFARKKAANDLILSQRQHLRQLVSAATKTSDAAPPVNTIGRPQFAAWSEILGSFYVIDASMDAPKDDRGDEEFVRKMFVYTEVDNLEFVFEKHHDGLLDARETLRTVLIFESRCEAVHFRELASELVKLGRYQPDLATAVEYIALLATKHDDPEFLRWLEKPTLRAYALTGLRALIR